MGVHNSMRSGRSTGLALGPYDPWADQLAFGSYHPSTVFFVFGDGRIEGLLKGIAGSVLSLLSNRSDRQPVPSY
jgi:hypothetical protein